MENKFKYRTAILLLFMLVIIGLRVIAPLSPDFKLIANFSGMGAVALFGGAYFKNKINAFLLPIFILFLSDLALILTMGKEYSFYTGWYYTYIAFVLIVLIGHLIIKKVNVQRVLIAGFAAVLIHWIVSDIGAWLGYTTYAHTPAGFWACLVAAIPYELNFLYGTMGYAALMFGVFESLKIKYPALVLSSSIH
jgi:hypothetical protein